MTELEQIARKYRQLLLAVGIKYARESKHDTALRFIKERGRQEEEDRARKSINKNNRFNWHSYL